MTTVSMQKISWAGVVTEAFVQKVASVCKNLGWRSEQISHLMACMAFESGETFSPSIKNAAGSGATGLIQFMPTTARGLGTTVELLAAMSAVDQLAFVEIYFRPYCRKIKNLSDMYMAILMPKYIGADEDAVLFNQGTIMYRQNSGLDEDSNGIITKAEASAKVLAKLNKGFNVKYVKLIGVPYA